MKHRCSLRPKALILPVVVMIGFAAAGALRAAPIPATLKTSTDAAASAKVIQDAVHEEVQKLVGDDAPARAAARDALINDASAPGGTPSSQYLDTFAAALATELAPHATDKSVLVRLNVAIVAARVANKADNARLAPVIVALLNDKNESVLIWALRGAKGVLPAILRAPAAVAKSDKTISLIVPTVQAHGQSSYAPHLAQEAYAALMLNYLDREKVHLILPDTWKSMVTAGLGEVSKLMRWRMEFYKNGAPADPLIETDAVNFLVYPDIWKAQTAEQKTASLQLVCDLMSLAANAATAADKDREQLITLVKNAGKALQAAVALHPKPEERDAINQVLSPIQQINQTTKNVNAIVAPVCPALKKYFPALMPTTLPTTQPAH